MTDNASWSKAISSATYEDLNRFIAPAKEARESGNLEPARMLAEEARRRHYHFAVELGRYVEMKATKHDAVIGYVGWSGGLLFVEFHGKPKVYSHPNVPQEDCFKLLRVPFANALYHRLKAKWPKEEVNGK